MAEYFSSNLKHLREQRNMTQTKLADMIGVNQTTIARWEDDNRVPTIDNAIDVANALNISLVELVGKDLRFDNAEFVQLDDNTVKIPVYGTIKAGIPIESQTDIVDYVEIPKSWTKGEKKFYGLKISGDSMFPKYDENDVVIFEQNKDVEAFKNKDCAVMINGTESTFKKVLVNEQGIVLQPYNTGGYDIMMFSKEDVERLPVEIVGIAREIRRKP